MSVRKKAFVYLIRSRSAGSEILVFDSHDEAGFEVVKGGSKPGETLENTARRELREEAGIVGARFLSRLGSTLWNGELQGFCLMEAPAGVPDCFEHVVGGEGIDRGIRYSFSWLPIDSSLGKRLVQGCGAFVDELIARTAMGRNE